jgi:hypothetical protein
VPHARLEAARQMAEQAGLSSKVDIYAIEQFVGQNVEEMGKCTRLGKQNELRRLLETYNRRVDAVETDKAIMIRVPQNL